jgi:RimJ/RimL family protein N-acetyltransferase
MSSGEFRIRGAAFQMPPPCIKTDRLSLRPRRLNDIDAIVEMDLNPDVHRYRDLRPETSMAIPDETTARNSVRSEILSSSPPHCWAVEWKNRQGFLGLVALNAKPQGIADLPDESGTFFLAYRLAKDTWGQGVASEAAGAILDYAFRSLDCRAVMAFSHVENIRSRRVLEKITMRLVGRAFIQPMPAASGQSNPETSKLELLEKLNTVGSQVAVYLCYRLG